MPLLLKYPIASCLKQSNLLAMWVLLSGNACDGGLFYAASLNLCDRMNRQLKRQCSALSDLRINDDLALVFLTHFVTNRKS